MKKVMFAAAFAALVSAGQAGAQQFPARPVTMVIPFAAGGPQDTIGRVIAQRMSELLGQQVVVENVGGAGGMTGSKRVADAKPDGYTMVLGSVGTHAQNQTLYKRPLYNVETDFTPVAYLAITPIALITRPDLPATNLKDFVAYAKANQGKMQFGSAGAGSATHLGCVALNTAMGAPMITHVPYKEGDRSGNAGPYRRPYRVPVRDHRDGQAANRGPESQRRRHHDQERSPVLPDLAPTVEQGLDVQAYTWSSLFLPKGAPADVVKKLNEAAVGAIATPSVQERLAKAQARPLPHRTSVVRNGLPTS